ncbi:MAG: DUF1566 domain-containing protein [bacterium]
MSFYNKFRRTDIFLLILALVGFFLLSKGAFAQSVPDTGQNKCYDDSGWMPSCDIQQDQPFYGQDSHYNINPLSYTKIDELGNVLPASAPEWVVVRDNVTGLYWEVKTNSDNFINYSDHHDADNKYTWYNPDDPDDPGQNFVGTDTKDLIDRLNNEVFGGFADWRLPTIKELHTLVIWAEESPAINSDYFPNCNFGAYWSSTTRAAQTLAAWRQDFSGKGSYNIDPKNSFNYVRAVRADDNYKYGECLFHDNEDGTITDNSTGLMWEKVAADDLTWEEALSYCEQLVLGGFDDWRLPNQHELESLVDYSKSHPAIDLTYFPDQTSNHLFYSSTSASSISASGVYFDEGQYTQLYFTSENATRAVRSGQSAGITISPISGPTTEPGGQATFRLKLNSQPNGNVVLTLVSSDTTEGTVSKNSITFTDDNWNVFQKLTVTGVNDELDDGDQNYIIQLTVDTSNTTDTTGYTAIDPDDVSVKNIDNETAGYTISRISGDTYEDAEEESATFTIKLNTQPDGNLVINVVSSDTTEGNVSPQILTFTGLNWDTEQIVTVTGVDDDLADGNINYSIILTVDPNSSTDTTSYTEVDPETGSALLDPDDIAVRNIDNDAISYIISEISGNTSEEGAEASFSMKLGSQPNGNVVINVVSSNQAEGSVSESTLIFASLEWNVEQIVTVTGVDDDVSDGNQNYVIELTIDPNNTTDTTGYNSLNPHDISVTNIDNEIPNSPGFIIGAITQNTTEDEGVASFTVRLNTSPNGAVMINVDSSDTTEGIVSLTTLTFTAENWNTDQIVSVMGMDDDEQDGDQSYSIQLTINIDNTEDTTGYAALDLDDVSVMNMDNEEALPDDDTTKALGCFIDTVLKQ